MKTKTPPLLFMLWLMATIATAQVYTVPRKCNTIYIKYDSSMREVIKQQLFNRGFLFEFEGNYFTTKNLVRYKNTEVALTGLTIKTDTGTYLCIKGTCTGLGVNVATTTVTQRTLTIEARCSRSNIFYKPFLYMIKFASEISPQIYFATPPPNPDDFEEFCKFDLKKY